MSPTPDRPSLIGQTLNSCRVDEIVGKGGMGVVYRGMHLMLDRPVAIKVLGELFDDNEQARKRFVREARTAAQLNHPNLLKIFDVGVHDGQHFMVMEFIEGLDLAQRIDQSGPVPPAEVVEIALQACDGLAAAHKAGIIHRDLKPDNLIATDDGLKIIDFGLARAEASTNTTQVTMAGQIIGTPHYMAPEQCRGEECDYRTDIYALGMTLYCMLLGRPAFDGPLTVILVHQIEKQPVAPHRVDSAIPEALSAVVMKTLAKHPDHRYADINALIDDLQAVKEGRSPAALDAPIPSGDGLTPAQQAAASAPTRMAAPPVPPRPVSDTRQTTNRRQRSRRPARSSPSGPRPALAKQKSTTSKGLNRRRPSGSHGRRAPQRNNHATIFAAIAGGIALLMLLLVVTSGGGDDDDYDSGGDTVARATTGDSGSRPSGRGEDPPTTDDGDTDGPRSADGGDTDGPRSTDGGDPHPRADAGDSAGSADGGDAGDDSDLLDGGDSGSDRAPTSGGDTGSAPTNGGDTGSDTGSDSAPMNGGDNAGTSPPPSDRAGLAAARKALDAGDKARAMALLVTYTNASNDAQAMRLLAELALEARKDPIAIQALAGLIELAGAAIVDGPAPTDQDLLWAAGKLLPLYDRSGQIPRALEAAEAVLAEVEDTDLRLGAARRALGTRQHLKAARLLLHASLAGNDAATKIARLLRAGITAAVAPQMSRHPEWPTVVAAMSRVDPDYWFYQLAAGDAAGRRGDWNTALAHYTRALSLKVETDEAPLRERFTPYAKLGQLNAHFRLNTHDKVPPLCRDLLLRFKVGEPRFVGTLHVLFASQVRAGKYADARITYGLLARLQIAGAGHIQPEVARLQQQGLAPISPAEIRKRYRFAIVIETVSKRVRPNPFKPGDQLIAIGDDDVTDEHAAYRTLGDIAEGDLPSTTAEVVRKGKLKTLRLRKNRDYDPVGEFRLVILP